MQTVAVVKVTWNFRLSVLNTFCFVDFFVQEARINGRKYRQTHLQVNNYWILIASTLNERVKSPFLDLAPRRPVACFLYPFNRDIGSRKDSGNVELRLASTTGHLSGINQRDLFPNITASRLRWGHGHGGYSTAACPFSACKRCCSCRVTTTKGSMVAKDSG